MYQALYRKYRPKTFDEVIDQDVITHTLTNSIVNNKINHAYLLTGPRGCGKTTIAKIFAQLVNCEHTDGKNLCNKCVFCTHKQEQSLDIIEMDAASNNGVDEIREINNKANLVPSIGKYKIYIIDEVHMLTIGAFNALLKTLEEPPAHVIFILATTDPQKVPITILSRCQRFDLKKISTSKIFDRLKYICDQEKIKYNKEALLEVSKLGDGCLRDSISILDQVISYVDDAITIDDVHAVSGTLSLLEISNLMNNLIKKNIKNIIESISNYVNDGKNIIKITEDIIEYIKSCILYKNGMELENFEIYKEFIGFFSTDELLNQINIMNETLFDMKKFSDPKLLLELSFIKLIGQNNIKNEEITEKKIDEKQEKKNLDKEERQNIEMIEDHEEIEKKSKITNDNINDTNKKFEKFIELRINNALSNFSKKITLDLKKKVSDLVDYIMDEENSNIITMIIDSNLRAASDEYLIFTCKTEHLSELFNKNIEDIEKILKKHLNKEYKTIATSDDNWEIIKKEFNNKEKQYVYQKEDFNVKEILEEITLTSDDNMKSLFGELVEYK